MSVAVVIPASNNAATLPRVIASVRGQLADDIVVDELIVIDDGSHDDTNSVARGEGVRVAALATNCGRGAARARALAETSAPFVMMVDATKVLPPDFLTLALPWFEEERVAAVFGHVRQPPAATVAERWRGRHLFKPTPSGPPVRDALLTTAACVLRRSAVEAVGGFDPTLRAGEDAELGRRLLAQKWEVVADPRLYATCVRSDSAHEALARYARWNSPHGLGGRSFLRQCAYAVKSMAAADLKAHDPLAALLSLASPFYQLWLR